MSADDLAISEVNQDDVAQTLARPNLVVSVSIAIWEDGFEAGCSQRIHDRFVVPKSIGDLHRLTTRSDAAIAPLRTDTDAA